VHAVDHRVGGLHQPRTARGTEHRRVVPNADNDVGAGSGQMLAKPGDERAFSLLADGHERPRGQFRLSVAHGCAAYHASVKESTKEGGALNDRRAPK
jgi:hypothetical protein